MRFQITVKQQNPDFSKEYADEYHFGKESENNQKYNWSRGFELSNEIDKEILVKNSDYQLQGELTNGSKIDIKLPNMTILKCYSNNELLLETAVSTELVKRTLKTPYNERHNIKRFYFYLKPREDYTPLGEYDYILNKDIPIELSEILEKLQQSS